MRNLIAFLLLLAVPPLAGAETAWFTRESGAGLFHRFCAACHGDNGLGDGPVAPVLDVYLPDLTQLTVRFGGKFPEQRVREIIDGRAVIAAHGSRQMPVWGYEFEMQAEGDESARATAQAAIDRLADYLKAIQMSAPAPAPSAPRQ